MFICVIQRQNEQNKQIFQCTYSFQANTRFMLCAVVALAGCSNDETSQTGELQDKVMGTASTVTFSTKSSATQATTMTRTSISHNINNGATPYWSATSSKHNPVRSFSLNFSSSSISLGSNYQFYGFSEELKW